MVYSGQPLKRFEDSRLLRGGGSFVDDMKLPDMLYACVARSPHAHARILSVDISAARGRTGVVEVLTGQDIAGQVGDVPPRHTPEPGGICCAGAPCARQRTGLLCGPTRRRGGGPRPLPGEGRRRCGAISYQPLTPLLDPLEAADSNSAPVHEQLGGNVMMRMRVGRGGLARMLRSGRPNRRGKYQVPRLVGGAHGRPGPAALYEPGPDQLTLWSSTQTPFRTKTHLETLLPRPPAKIGWSPQTWAVASAKRWRSGRKTWRCATWPSRWAGHKVG